MTQTPVDQERFNIDGGDVTITFPGNLSRQGIEDLEARLVVLIERLRRPHETDRQAWLRGLAELAAYETSSQAKTMQHAEFEIGMEFTTQEGGRRWRVTDVGTRVVTAIRIDQVESSRGCLMSFAEAEEAGWFRGPPYALAERIFAECDQPACQPCAKR
jgi:hypothetical protein